MFDDYMVTLGILLIAAAAGILVYALTLKDKPTKDTPDNE